IVTVPSDNVYEAAAHPDEVDDARIGDVDRFNPDGMRLELLQLLTADDPTGNTVLDAAFVNRPKPGSLPFVHRHDHLAANIIRDAFALTKFDELAIALPAIPGFQRTGAVVNT